jgi:hypothetical protein
VLYRIEEVVESLATCPEPELHPEELLALAIRGYRQALFKPYRLIDGLLGASSWPDSLVSDNSVPR